MMPKLPHPAVGREWDEPLYTIEQMEAYGRAVAEACESLCREVSSRYTCPSAGEYVARLCANEIREAAKEIK